mgnify:CR=1 FL=1
MSLKYRLLIIAAIPLVLLTIMAVNTIHSSWVERSMANTFVKDVALASDISNLVHEMQRERGASAGFISSRGKSFANDLSRHRQDVDAAIQNLAATVTDGRAIHGEKFAPIKANLDRLRNFRNQVTDQSASVPEVAKFYTDIIDNLMTWSGSNLTEQAPTNIAPSVASYLYVDRAKEKAGLERAMGAAGFGAGNFNNTVYKRFASLGAQQDALLTEAEASAKPTQARLINGLITGSAETKVRNLRSEADQNALRATPLNTSGSVWFATATARIDEMYQVQSRLVDGMRSDAASVASVAGRQLFITLGMGIFFIAVTMGATIYSVRIISSPLESLRNTMVQIGEGDYNVEIENDGRTDEIGAIATTLKDVASNLKAGVETTRTAVFKGSAFEGASKAMMMVDRDFNVTFINEATVALLGKHADAFREMWPSFNPDNMVGTNIDIFHKNPGHQRKILSDPSNLPYTTDISLGDLRISLHVTGVFDQHGEYVGNTLEWDDVTETRTNVSMLEALDASQAIIEFDLDGKIINANQNFLKAMGYRLDEIAGRHHRMFVDPSFAESVDYQGFWESLGRGEVKDGKFLRYDKTGNEVWIQASYNPVLDGNGKPFKVVKFAADITEAEEKGREALFKSAAFGGSSIAMMMIDRDFQVTYVNDSTRAMLSTHADAFRKLWPTFNGDQIIGTCIDMFHKNPNHQRQLLSDPKNLPYRTDITVGDLKFALSVSGVFDGKGNYVGNVLEWDDVTEARTNSGILSALNKAQAVIEFDVDGRILNANENFLATMGYRASDVIGQHHSMFVDQKYAMSNEYREFWDRLGQGEAAAEKFKRIGRGGKEVWIHAIYNPIIDANGKVFKVVKFASDITQQEIDSNENFSKIDAIARSQAVIEFELDGTIIDANQNFLDAMGYLKDEIVGKKHALFVEEDYGKSEEYRQFWDGLRRGEYRDGTFKRQAKGDRDVWIMASYHPVLDLNGNPYKVVKFASDVTQAELDRRAVEEERKAHAAEQEQVVQTLADGLQKLSVGNLTANIEQEFPGEYKQLRMDFNAAVTQLRDVMSTVVNNANGIERGVNEISQAADDLSKRTENQAASLEETAAALNQATTAVNETAGAAKHAYDIVGNARNEATESGEIVREAVSAMSEIERSSGEINQIISVIDEIAFQTNLLALNAGVEAARAGEAGRGFAVVASEVRALAQRSSDAAKEIKQLISASTQHVDSGVDLVGKAGSALGNIVERVAEVSQLVSNIASSAEEQSRGLGEINSAVNQMDQVTQQNAAMVEQSTAASHALKQEANELIRMVSHFSTGDAGAAPIPQASNPGVVEQQQRVASFAATNGNAAIKIDGTDSDDDWAEF